MPNGNSRTYFLCDGDKVVCEENSGGTLINTYGDSPAGLVQRHIQSIPAYIGYTFDPQGTVVQRHRQYDSFVAPPTRPSTTPSASSTLTWMG